MRRVYLLGVVAALAVLAAAVFSASAGARTESRFSVVADPTAGHAHANAFHLRGRLRDPFGQQWMMSKRIEHVSADEMNRRAARFFGSG